MNRSGSALPKSRTHRLVSAFAAVVALTTGMVALQTTVAQQPEAAAASAVGGSISRAEVIARAKYWYNRGDTWYSQDQSDAKPDGDGHTYRPDCSGLVAMAWHLPKKSDGWDLNTDGFADYSGKSSVSLDDLQPGDALLRSGHIELFEKWVDASDHHEGAWVYSENTYGQKTNHNIDYWSELSSYRGIRYNKITGGASNAGDGADFNGDGDGDIFSTATGVITIWNGKGSNNFDGALTYGRGWDAYSRPIAGDFNDDGVSDLAATSNGELHIWNGRGNNDFTADTVTGPGWSPYAATLFTVGDINGDNHTDIGAISGGTLYTWNGLGNNKFSAAVAHGAGWSSYSRPIGGDFNADGIGDIAAVTGGQLHIWNGKGSNNFADDIVTGPGWSPYATTLMDLGDINGDGHSDLGATSGGVLYTWNGQGADKFAAAVVHGAGWSPYF
ncbi:FG-GAP repeat domain-containing protein [Amycolatopsis sp. NPDC088138]|uniref:FG-GAP repeat domain-containing protein n=1 Tax=Amycolatopsis sp. NPDC088138 TaxID=3363938 RepID=UPI0038106072